MISSHDLISINEQDGTPTKAMVLSPEPKNWDRRRAYYLVTPNDWIGEGSQSKVYRGQRLEPVAGQTPLPISMQVYNPKYWLLSPKSNYVAVKIVREMELQKSEIEIMQQVQPTENPIEYITQDMTFYYLITRFIPGIPLQLQAENPKLTAFDTSKLTALQRTKLACEIANEIYLLHYPPDNRTRKIIHCDIKPSNFLISGSDLLPEARLIDWGSATYVEDDKPIAHQFMIANPAYSPIETTQGYYGMKTDIYMLVNPIAFVLGQPHPDQHKIITEQDKASSSERQSCAPFAIDQIIRFSDYYPEKRIDELVAEFLNRMQLNNYDLRPDANQVRLFFSTLFTLIGHLEHLKNNPLSPSRNEKIETLLAKLFLLATNQWQNPIRFIRFPGDDTIKIANACNNIISESFFENDTALWSAFTRGEIANFFKRLPLTIEPKLGIHSTADVISHIIRQKRWHDAAKLLLLLDKEYFSQPDLEKIIHLTVENYQDIVKGVFSVIDRETFQFKARITNSIQEQTNLFGHIRPVSVDRLLSRLSVFAASETLTIRSTTPESEPPSPKTTL